MTAHLTSNQYYRGLNRRFDRRAKRLRSMGFTYVLTDDYGAMFKAPRKPITRGIPAYIPAIAVSSADNRVFYDLLRRILGN